MGVFGLIFIQFCVVFLWYKCVFSETIKEIIENRIELSQVVWMNVSKMSGPVGIYVCGKLKLQIFEFHNFAKELDLFDQLDIAGDEQYTAFVPSNDALLPRHLPSVIQNQINNVRSNSNYRARLNDIFKYHVAIVRRINHYHTLMTADMQDMSVGTLLGGNSRLFVKRINQTLYVNGARLVEGHADLQASNGVVHVIDAFLFQTPYERNALSVIMNNALEDSTHTFDEFVALLRDYEDDMITLFPSEDHALDILNHNSVTLFVPPDSVFRSLADRNSINRARTDPPLLRKIVESHIIPGEVYHGNVLRDISHSGTRIAAMNGHIETKFFSNQLEVSNQCAKGRVLLGNNTVYNGVVHVIDGILGDVFNDIDAVFNHIGGVGSFAGIVRGDDTAKRRVDLSPGETARNIYTVFAPIDSSVREADIYSDSDDYEEVIEMHMLAGRVDTTQIDTGVTMTTLGDQNMRFIRITDENNVTDTFVEVNYVRARITDGDNCALNGIVHKIDHILGFPTKTIYDFISNFTYSSTYGIDSIKQVLLATGLEQLLADRTKRLSILVPTDRAFMAMRGDTEGANILNDPRKLRMVISRHLMKGKVILTEQRDRSENYATEFNNEMITVVKTRNNTYLAQFGEVNASVVLHDMRCTNGFLHIIDAVLYSNDLDASEHRGAATHLGCSGFSFLIMCLVCYKVKYF